MSWGEAAAGADFPLDNSDGYLTLGQSAYGWITSKGGVDGDWDDYRVYLSANVHYTFFATGTEVQGTPAAGHMYLELYNPSGIFNSGYAPDASGRVTATFTPTTSGFYYLDVSGDQDADFGGYRVVVSTSGAYADDHGAEFWTATHATSGRYSGIIERTNDTDSFLLNEEVGKRYFYTVDQQTLDLHQIVETTSHEALLAGPIQDAPVVVLTPTVSETIMISFTSDTFVQTGSYSFRLQETFTTDHEIGAGTFGDDILGAAATDDEIWGLEGNDSLIGDAGNDVLVGNEGDDILDGGQGDDTAAYLFDRRNYVVSQDQDGYVIVTDKRDGADGRDTVTGVEHFQFADGTFDLATLLATNTHNPTDIQISSDLVEEQSAPGTVVGSLTATDEDAGQTFHFSLVDSAGGRFAINDNQIVVANGSLIDFEQAQSYQIKVRVGDSGGDFFEKVLTVRVSDIVVETLKGTAGRDWLTGGSGIDHLFGGAGKDVLRGGAGQDVFAFDTKPNKTKNVDKILDFNVRDDSIWLDNKFYKKLGKKGSLDHPAKLKKAFFTVGDHAKDKNDYLIYDKKKGYLYYDDDGSGAHKAVLVATLSKHLKMTYKDFFVI